MLAFVFSVIGSRFGWLRGPSDCTDRSTSGGFGTDRSLSGAVTGETVRAPRKWSTTARHAVYEHPLLTFAQTTVEAQGEPGEAPTSRDVLVLESNDWVNVVALDETTARPQIVLIRQWRFGSQSQTLEIPGGLVDDGEAPALAARRELLEETGYSCGAIIPLGVVQPNPALFNNRCHIFLARELTLVGTPVGDGDEEIEVLALPLEEMSRLVRSGEIQHALVIAAMHLFDLWRNWPQTAAGSV